MDCTTCIAYMSHIPPPGPRHEGHAPTEEISRDDEQFVHDEVHKQKHKILLSHRCGCGHEEHDQYFYLTKPVEEPKEQNQAPRSCR